MEPKEPGLPAFRAGDFQRKKARPESREEKSAAAALRHYPHLEKLLDSDEEAIARFQQTCQNTCRNLDSLMGHPSDPAATAMCQSALAAYGQSLKLLAELLELKYQQLRQLAEKK